MSTDNTDGFPNRIAQGTSIDYGGIILTQQWGGNFQIYTGDLANLDCLVWESGVSLPPAAGGNYESGLRQQDGILGTRNIGVGPVWTTPRDTTAPFGPYYFSVDCDGNVGVYESPDLALSSAVWRERGTGACTIAQPVCRRTVLMTAPQRVESQNGPLQGDGPAYIEQLTNGNVVVRAGTPATPGEILWQSCSDDNRVTEYFTALQEDSQFITRPELRQSLNVWKRGGDPTPQNATGNWELALECNGDEFGKLVVADSANRARVVWETALRPTCPAPPGTGICPTATVLLNMNQQIWDRARIDTGNRYTLEQQRNGDLWLWKGTPSTGLECVLWTTLPQDRPNGRSYTVMQNDGNLVTYWARGNDPQNNPFAPIWASKTVSSMGSFTFVIDDCNPVGVANRKSVAVYEKNPITDPDAVRLTRGTQWEFVDSCPRRDRALRGGEESSQQ